MLLLSAKFFLFYQSLQPLHCHTLCHASQAPVRITKLLCSFLFGFAATLGASLLNVVKTPTRATTALTRWIMSPQNLLTTIYTANAILEEL
jgi:hypothetical protein